MNKYEKLAPIIIFAYNRLNHLQSTVEALKKNNLAALSDLYIFIDGPKNDFDLDLINEVRAYSRSVTGFNRVIVNERIENFGLANSIIHGVSEIISQYGKAIVLEDDIVTSEDFLEYMNEGLRKYEVEKKIFSIAGYSYPIIEKMEEEYNTYLFIRPSSWGWGTWKDRWEGIDWCVSDYKHFIKSKSLKRAFNEGGNDLAVMLKMQMAGDIDSWAVRWAYSAFKSRQKTLYPKFSKVQNIGLDNSGTHSRKNSKFDTKLKHLKKTDNIFNDVPFESDLLNNKLKKYFTISLLSKLWLILSTILNAVGLREYKSSLKKTIKRKLYK